MSHILPIDTTVEFYADTTPTPVVVTSDVLTVSISRGRSRWLDDVQTGTMSITMLNLDRDWDPSGSGAYASDIVPGRKFVIKTGGVEVFTGTVDDWNLSYSLNGDATITASCSDALSLLGRTNLDAFTATSQLSGVRIAAVLDRPEVGFPAGDRDIDNGLEVLQADTVASGTDVASYVKLIERTEAGRLFVSADGKLTFRDRQDTVASSPSATFSDTGSDIPYDAIGVQVGSELLFNRATVSRLGGVVRTADNTSSQTAYGIRALDYSGLLFNDDDRSSAYADFLVARYGEPRSRFETLDINLARLSNTQATTVIGLELGALIRVIYSPPGGGSAVDDSAIVEKIEHSIGIDSHRVRFSLSNALDQPFVLDDAVYGVLGSDYRLSF